MTSCIPTVQMLKEAGLERIDSRKPCTSIQIRNADRRLYGAGGQTGAAVVMVAERAAEILLRGSAGSSDVREPELALA